MRKEVMKMVTGLSVYEKYELSAKLLEEQKFIYGTLENVRHRTDEYCQGMLLAKESHKLNDLVIKQLVSIKGLADDAKGLITDVKQRWKWRLFGIK